VKIYLFLEYFDGENLLDILLKEKKLPTQIVLDILQQLLKTICYLQEVHNMVHRDLKLENILVKFLDGNKL
jgi:serine/threonine protein kinase